MAYVSLLPTLRTSASQDLTGALQDAFTALLQSYTQTRGGDYNLTTSPTSVSLSGLTTVDLMVVQNTHATVNVTLTYKSAAVGTITIVLQPGELHVCQDVDVAQAPTLVAASATSTAKLRVYAD